MAELSQRSTEILERAISAAYEDAYARIISSPRCPADPATAASKWVSEALADGIKAEVARWAR